MSKLSAFFQSLPDRFEENGYDYSRFTRLFGWGTLGVWVMVLSVYIALDSDHSFGGAVVAILAAIIVTLVLFPLTIAQSSRDYSSTFALHKDASEEEARRVKRKSQQKG